MTKCSIDWSDLSRVEAGFATTVSPREVRSKVHSWCVCCLAVGILHADLANSEVPLLLGPPLATFARCVSLVCETTTLQKRIKKPLSLLFFCNKATTTCATVDHSSFCASEDRQICFEENRSTEPDVRVFIVADSAE
jgi:hypothetical protein